MMFRKGIYVRDEDIGASFTTWLFYGAFALLFGFTLGTSFHNCRHYAATVKEFSHD